MSFPPTMMYKSPDARAYQDFKFKKITSCSTISPTLMIGDSANKSGLTELKSISSSKSAHSPKINDFRVIRPLGRGMFGQVYLAIHSLTGLICAIKFIKKDSLRGRDQEQTKKHRNQILREIKIQSFLNHPNIISLYSVFHDEKNIYLMMEYGTDGQLYSFLKKQQKLTQETTSFVIREILLALNYIHENEIIHRDIKPENIIISYGSTKLCDFGWSVHCPKQFRSTICGTPLYFSPQLLKGKEYDEKIDIWAIGILTHQLFTGQNPFQIRKRSEIAKIVTESFKMEEGSKSIKDFINSTLQKDPNKRITIKNMLSHPFIRKYELLEFSEEIVLNI